jgi:hypothetical protein
MADSLRTSLNSAFYVFSNNYNVARLIQPSRLTAAMADSFRASLNSAFYVFSNNYNVARLIQPSRLTVAMADSFRASLNSAFYVFSNNYNVAPLSAYRNVGRSPSGRSNTLRLGAFKAGPGEQLLVRRDPRGFA